MYQDINGFTDEEIEFDEMLRKLVKESEGFESTYVINPEGVKRLLAVYKVANTILYGKQMKISWELEDPFLGYGSVIILSPEVNTVHTDAFKELVDMSDGVTVTPRTDGVLEMSFDIYNVGIEV